MNFDELIGLKSEDAIELLQKNGYNNIEIVENFKNDDGCNQTLVCFAKEDGGAVKLVCGKFKILQ